MKVKRVRGPRGPKGDKGPAGPRGPEGAKGGRGRRGPEGGQIDPVAGKLAAQMEIIVKELQTQLTRIAQIQAQLDRLASGRPIERRSKPRDGTVQ